MRQSKTNAILIYILAGLSGLLLLYAIFRCLDNDEFEAIHTIWKIASGQIIYVDFFQHHHPFLYYLFAPFVMLFGATTNLIYLFRFFIYLMFLGIGAGTYKITKTFANQTTALLSTILLFSTPIFTIKAIEIRPDVPMTLCAIWAIYFWILFQQTHKSKYLYLNAMLLGTSFLFLQKAIFIIALVGLLFLAELIQKKVSIKEALLYFSSGISLPGIYALYLFFTSSFASYFTFNWTFNQKMLGGAPALPALIWAIATNAIVWILFFMGLKGNKQNQTLNTVRYFAVGFIIVFLFVPYSYQQYLLPAIPFVAIIAAYTLYHVAHEKKIFFLLLGLIVVPPLFTNYIRRVILSPVTQQIKKINYVLSITKPTDKVLDSELGFEAFNLFRNDIDFFWLGVLYSVPTYNLMKPYKYDVYELIEQHKPAVIGKLSVTKIPPGFKNKKKEYVIEKYYKPSEQYEDILVRK